MKRSVWMNKYIWLSLTALSLSFSAVAQDSFNLRYVTIDSLIKTLEQNTPHRFYYAPSQTDTLLLSLQSSQNAVLESLQNLLRKSSFSLNPLGKNQWVIVKLSLIHI